MDRYEQRLRKVSIGDVHELFNVHKQIQYSKQYKLKVGTELFTMDGNSKFVSSELFPRNAEEVSHVMNTSLRTFSVKPLRTLIIKEIKYKSRLQRFFRWFLKYPIASVVIEVVS